LPKIIQSIAVQWAGAQLQYALGNYEITIETLKDWSPKDKFFAIQAKATLLKANFKLLMKDATRQTLFNSYCLSYEKYIKRNKLYSEHRSTSYLKFIQFIRKVAQLAHNNPTNQQWDNLINEIQKEKVIFGKNWLKTEITLIRDIEEGE